MRTATVGIASTMAAIRTQRCCQMMVTRKRRRGASGLDGDNPVAPEVERQLLVQAFDERGAVLVQERQEADGAFLGVAAGKGERPRVHELPAQRFVAALG